MLSMQRRQASGLYSGHDPRVALTIHGVFPHLLGWVPHVGLMRIRRQDAAHACVAIYPDGGAEQRLYAVQH
ncbi:MAG: hypothetical protein Q7S96_01100 [bacterium]|nr:hypothetical protein [bacterium]